ncbi:bifunctional lytic transglycosylase/C40 family peptidase [Streptomyces sp. RB6PN25]|uniref:Bifunctional lytic transglycosylase/C40 family peptidase n=1 Tax=Streptomyces humicola TaxID=2953240 RepID=A0ABT1Q3X5_9ACTN|nr:bifunctional lytic transglycosylase/C40 family peptidase [Streptomyces humicola]MCQ4084579.1 bifunctional lytic transglycosylase/C40 family peptidase [Streptomyces humicola]
MGGTTTRKAWLAVTVVAGVCFSFLALLVIGTYSAAASLFGSTQAAVGLAPGTVPAAYQSLVQRWGTMCSAISPPLLAAQLYQESGWNPSAQSSAGAQGIAQFMPGTWATYGLDASGDGTANVWDPADAIPSAAAYDCELAKDVSSVPGDTTDNMLAAYNAGVYAVIQAHGVPPFGETQNYVKSIRTLAQSFSAPVGALAVSEQAAGAIYYAQSKLGTPYLWGGTGTAAEGGRFDCSGLTQAAYASVGIQLPRVANDQWNAGPHPSRSELLPGDLVFFATDLNDPRSIHHVGIYVGGGYMIDAPHTGATIRFDPIDEPDYIGATRVTQAGAAALPTALPGSR